MYRELEKLIDEVVVSIGAETMADMGKVMSTVMGKTKGRADGSKVSRIVKEKLNG